MNNYLKRLDSNIPINPTKKLYSRMVWKDKIVWCNGTFDILHPGHIELFKVGASLGKKLIVATDTDEKIRQDKGAFKPRQQFV